MPDTNNAFLLRPKIHTILVKQKNEIDIPCSRPLSIPAPDKEKR